jgi:hypothetical protein
MDETGEVTLLLQRWREGDPGALEDLMPLVYSQRQRITDEPASLLSEPHYEALRVHRLF